MHSLLCLSGYGVFATEDIESQQFLLEYVGTHIPDSKGEDLLNEYSEVDAAFLFFYKFQGKSYWYVQLHEPPNYDSNPKCNCNFVYLFF